MGMIKARFPLVSKKLDKIPPAKAKIPHLGKKSHNLSFENRRRNSLESTESTILRSEKIKT